MVKVSGAGYLAKCVVETLTAGDAAAVTDQAQIAIRSKSPSEVLLFDLS